MKYCEKCDKKFDDNINFCPICGNTLSTDEEPIKFCPICGKELEKGTNFCPMCGNPTTKPNNENYVKYDNDVQAMRPPVQGVGVIMAFMIISCFFNIGFLISYALSGIYAAMVVLGILPFFWKIPMTIYFCNSAQNFKKVSTSFKVCTLLFVSFISGIILLSNKDL